jgi:glyoxylase I family protein
MLKRMHHIAYVVKDQEATRHFYEDVLGLPLIATWSEVGPFKAFPGRQVEYCHTFFGLGDGSALAFFAFADEEVYETLRNHNGLAHVAIAVSPAEQQEVRRRLKDAGLEERFIDHGYVQSVYVDDPDQAVVEFTAEPKDAAKIAALQRATAHETLSRWLDGDRSPNNDLR